MGNGKETAGKLDLGLRTSLGGGLSRNEFPMEARVPIALEFEEVWTFIPAVSAKKLMIPRW